MKEAYVFPLSLFSSCVCEWKLPFMFHVIFNQDPFNIGKNSWIECNFWDLPVKVFSVGSLCGWVSTSHGSECCSVLCNAWKVCYSSFSVYVGIGNKVISAYSKMKLNTKCCLRVVLEFLFTFFTICSGNVRSIFFWIASNSPFMAGSISYNAWSGVSLDMYFLFVRSFSVVSTGTQHKLDARLRTDTHCSS